MTGRSAGNALTKTTAVLAAAFFATSLSLIDPRAEHRHAGLDLNHAGSGSGRRRVAAGLVLPSTPPAPARSPAGASGTGRPAGPQAPQSK